MNERAFTKGQEVYLKIIEGSNVYRGLPKEANGKPDILKRLIPTTVTSVNKKYVTVDYKNTKFEVENDYREHSDYSSNYELFKTAEDAINAELRDSYWKKLKAITSYTYNCPYTLEQLEKVLNILTINENNDK